MISTDLSLLAADRVVGPRLVVDPRTVLWSVSLDRASVLTRRRRPRARELELGVEALLAPDCFGAFPACLPHVGPQQRLFSHTADLSAVFDEEGSP